MYEERERERKTLEWRKKQIQLRKCFSDTPAGFQNKEAETEAMIQLESDWTAWEKGQQNGLVREYQPVSERFVGRERELSQISEIMERKSGVPVILYGIGGIGKSALAHAWILRRQSFYQHILNLKFCLNFCDTICNDDILPIENLSYREKQHGSKKKYFRIKMRLLRSLAEKEKTLILIDGCNVIQDRNMEEVFALPCDFLVTTRVNPVLWGYSDGILVGALGQDTEWKALEAAYGQMASEKNYREFLERKTYFQGHTLRMIFEIRERGGENIRQELMKFGESLLMCSLLKQKEKNALCCLSILPSHRIPKSLFQTVTGYSEQVLIRLQNFFFVELLQEEQGEEMVVLHPVVAEAVRYMLPPTASACGRLIRGFAEHLRGRVNCCTRKENQYLEPYVRALLRAFPNPAAYLAVPFGDLCCFLEAQGYLEEARDYFFCIFDSVTAYFGELHQMTGQTALRIADIFYKEMEKEKAGSWYLEALRILESSVPANRTYYQHLSLACCRIARGFRQENRMEEAEVYLEKAVVYLKHYRVMPVDTDDFFRLLQSISLEQAWRLMRKGQTDQAEQICGECVDAAKRRFGERVCRKEWEEILKEIRSREKS